MFFAEKNHYFKLEKKKIIGTLAEIFRDLDYSTIKI